MYMKKDYKKKSSKIFAHFGYEPISEQVPGPKFSIFLTSAKVT